MTHRKIVAGAAGVIVVAAGGFAAIGASGAISDTAVVKQSSSIEMKPNRYIKDNLRFNKDVYRVRSGGTLKVVLTQADEGPHTVTLVKRRDLPSNAQEAFEHCRVCERLGKAHGADPNSDAPPKFKFLENGVGQNKPPDYDRPGDSGITGSKKGSTFSADVTARAGSTRYFMCLIHPWMQAKLVVQ